MQLPEIERLRVYGFFCVLSISDMQFVDLSISDWINFYQPLAAFVNKINAIIVVEIRGPGSCTYTWQNRSVSLTDNETSPAERWLKLQSLRVTTEFDKSFETPLSVSDDRPEQMVSGCGS